MSVTCELCGRTFKNTQGLRGHKTFYHNQRKSSNTPVENYSDSNQKDDIEDRLDKLEYITGARQPNILDKYLYPRKTLITQLTEITEQLGKVTQQLSSLSDNTPSNTQYEELKKQVSSLLLELSEYRKWSQPINTITGIQTYLEDELSSKASNTRVNDLEHRLRILEEEQQTLSRNLDILIEYIANLNIEKILKTFSRTLEQSTVVIGQLRKQANEQKKVTDWVKKKNNLFI